MRKSALLSIPLAMAGSVITPKSIAVIAASTAAIAGIAWYALRTPKLAPEEIERRRRDLLAANGRITDGSITDAPSETDDLAPRVIVYNYRIAGVSYECAQDITLLAEHIHEVRSDLPIQVRYDPHNPADSIVVAESWSGLRFSDPPHHPEAS